MGLIDPPIYFGLKVPISASELLAAQEPGSPDHGGSSRPQESVDQGIYFGLEVPVVDRDQETNS